MLKRWCDRGYKEKFVNKIDFANLKKAHEAHKEEVEEAILRVSRNANYIMGEEVESLENELVEFVGSDYAVTCSSGVQH